MVGPLQTLYKLAFGCRSSSEITIEATRVLQTGEDYVRIYRCHVIYLAIGMAALGVVAQDVAGCATAAALWQVLAINAVSALCLLATLWLTRAGLQGWSVIGAIICTYLIVLLGLLHLNGGWDGSHLYPALWIYSVVGFIGLYGSWLLTGVALIAGIAVSIGGKLTMPDFLFGIGADQSWARVTAMVLWWNAGLLTAGLCGHRVVCIARAGMQALEALAASRAEADLAREREQATAALAARTAELRDAHRIARIGVWRRDLVLGTLTLSDELHQLFGTDPRTFEATPENLLSIVHPEDRAATAAALTCTTAGKEALEHHWRMLRPDGSVAWLWAETHLETDASGRIVAVRGMCQDVSEHRAAAEHIHRLAHYDPLTGLANRALLRERLTEALAFGRRSGSSLAVLCLDLDGFKGVNDLYGHGAGDELLREVAGRLTRNVRETDTVARLGGDEFVVLQTDPGQPQAARSLAERLVAVLSEPYDLGASETQSAVTASVGVALFPSDGGDPDTLLHNADTALYRAKGAGKNGAAFFQPRMDYELRERRALERDLRQAASQGAFTLAWQPISSAGRYGGITGFEVLLRWNRPEHGMVPPDRFIPVAEACGAITAIGAWVLRQACREAAHWRAPLQVAVNVSPLQAQQGETFAEMVEQVLVETGLAPSRLILEVTEGVLIRDAERVLSALNRLKALGVRFALDDFGTGYSSLATLRAFPFDKLKIDRSFVAEVGKAAGARDAAIVEAVLGLARGMRLPVVAEGVETDVQLGVLREAGCEEVQGWLVGRPAPIESFAHLTGLDAVMDVNAA